MKQYKKAEEVPCQFYYDILDPLSIWNFLEIPDKLKSTKREFYDTLEKSILKEGFRNPIYIIAVEPYPQKMLEQKFKTKRSWRAYHTHHDFFWTNDADEPIWLPRKRIPFDMLQEKGYLLVCRNLGGSRLEIAQKHNIKIPCLISDFTGAFKHLEELKTKELILDYFTDRPGSLSFNSYGICSLGLPNTYLENL